MSFERLSTDIGVQVHKATKQQKKKGQVSLDQVLNNEEVKTSIIALIDYTIRMTGDNNEE